MPRKTISLVHGKTSEHAVRIVSHILNQITREYALYISSSVEQWNVGTCVWNFQAIGTTISVAIDVRPDRVVFVADFPSEAVSFWNSIAGTIRDRSNTLLA